MWPADAGILAGHPTGERTFMVEITRPMGSYHIIDGEKVVIRYRNQDKTCAGCQKPGHQANNCPGPRVHLSDYMRQYWQEISYVPDNSELGDL